MAKPTREYLERRVRSLEAYEAFFWLRNEKPIVLRSGEWTIKVVGLNRSHGGLVLTNNGHNVQFAVDFCIRVGQSADPYLRDLANQIHREQRKALEARSA